MMQSEENAGALDYKHLFDDNPLPMLIFDIENFNILTVNNAAIHTYGYDREEFLSLTMLDIRPHEDIDRLKDYLEKNRHTGFKDSGYWRHIKKSGELFYVHIFSSPTKFNNKAARICLVNNANEKIFTEQENKKLQKEVSEQKEMLEDILSSIKEAVWSRRIEDGKLIYINSASTDIFGYTPEEMTKDGGKGLEHVHPDDVPQLEEQIRRNYKEGHAEMEYRIFHKDGSMKYVLTHANLKKDNKGEPVVYNGVTIDITRLRNVENALRKKIEEIENVFESISDAFISVDRDWIISYTNKHFEKLFGMDRQEMVGKDFWTIFPKAKGSRYYQNYLKTMNERVAVFDEGPAASINKVLSASFYPIENGMALYFKDITEEHKLQDELINKEQKLRAIINNTKDIIWSIDKEMGLLSANQAYYDRVALMTAGKNYHELQESDFAKERIDKWNGYFKRVLGGEVFKKLEEDVVEGKTVFEEISFNPIYDKDNRIAGASCFSRDITDQVEHLLMIQEQNEKLKTIAWIQSHKVRGPVASILGLVDVFNMHEANDLANKEVIDAIKIATTQLDNVIREVVANTRMDHE